MDGLPQKRCFSRAGLLRQLPRFPTMHISSAIFDRSAPDLASCPDETLPEFAFIGRSNVGKSSLLNLLAGAQGLARVSPTPGFTKLINLFTMNGRWRLVDLPGYGFAQVARADKSQFNRAVADYLEHRPNLCLVFALIDSGLPPQSIDLEFIGWLAGKAIPFVLVFTKTDRSLPAEVKANIDAFMAAIAPWFVQPPAVFTCSATAGQGRQELLGVIGEAMAAIRAGRVQPAGDGAAAPQPPPGMTRREIAKAAKRRRPNPARPW
jgi:GTP-binding protein